MQEQTTLQKILSIGFLVAIFAMCVTLLLLTISSRQQRSELQKSSNKILCVLLINPADRNEISVKRCDR